MNNLNTPRQNNQDAAPTAREDIHLLRLHAWRPHAPIRTHFRLRMIPTIIHRASGRAEGLTTAASLLMSTAIGIAVALSAWILAGGATALTLVTLRGVSALERRQVGTSKP